MYLQETLTYPPTDGSVLLPDTLLFHKKHNANVPMYLFMENEADDLTRVTYGHFERACRRVSRATGINTQSTTRPVVAVIALADTLVYQTIVVGVMAAGFIPFPISPRNTVPAIVNLLRITSCHRVVATCVTLKDLIDDVQQELERAEPAHILSIEEAPNFFELFPEISGLKFQDGPEISHPTGCGLKLEPDDVALYLHSSGSTGLPKAIPKTHREIIEYILSRRSKRPRVAGMQLPPFHAMGIVLEVFLPLFSCAAVVLFPPAVTHTDALPVPATPVSVLDYVRRTGCNAMVSIPAFLRIWAAEPDAVDTLRGLELVLYSGGSISKQLGDFLVESGIALKTIYGGTETGGPAFSSNRAGDEREWEYLEFSERCKVRWVPQGDETFECQLLTTPTHHLSVCNLPDVEGYATSDLFKQHPSKDYLWKIVGRLDDVIIHTSGEKTVPPPLESIMMGSSHIMGVAMFGSGHDQAGVLVEPSSLDQINVTDVKQVADFLNLIWPAIDEANQRAPAFSKIYKEMVIVTDRYKPLPRAPKGTVIRAQALLAYATEIEARYTQVASMHGVGLVAPPDVWNRACLVQWVLCQVRELCPGKDMVVSKSLFDQGVDSLSATILRRRIIGALAPTAAPVAKIISQNVIYQYPSIEALAEHVLTLMEGHVPLAESAVAAHVKEIENMINKYSFTDPATPAPVNAAYAARAPVILLTGSTGHLGAEILQGFLRDPRVERVYALNRASPAGVRTIQERHADRFRDQGLDTRLLRSAKLVHVQTDINAPRLGLSDDFHNELCSRVTVVIHVAWALDFNFPLAAFESHVRGTYHLLTLARAAGSRFVFTSSVSIAQAWDGSGGRYPEEIVLDAKYAVGLGYGESKYVAERVIASSGLDSTSLRIGQISGSTNGAWAASDWVPILVKSGLVLECLPRAHGTVAWLPMPTVAACVLDVVWHAGRAPPTLNVVHPRATPWDTVMGRIADALYTARGQCVPLVPFSKWFALLESRAETVGQEDLADIPGVKLLDFFHQLRDGDLAAREGMAAAEVEACGCPQFSTGEAEALSRTLRNEPSLPPDAAALWVAYWCASGHFSQ
ncbi:hypothetical protein HYPSUDRAFT_212216 [Hypholoma sublateritium FD-334 SS-4]|uniref:Polyketide synthase-like phosphopantetheine-binding domain-containing protein n=1 Tax=Hypholoma sublateritium (strain FD-334 SS-4) TaxID=945553 RepID=A0A0D2PG92_HYPSF|nr:hypothetical protein HYPSUDRAFT_212216 [Hypholoma sublateritium FD-334 SS-4]